MQKVIIVLSIILIILIGILAGAILYGDNMQLSKKNIVTTDIEDDASIETIENIVALETGAEVEKTTPNTLIVYKTYYTKCKHYIQRYEDIDASLVNLTQKELKEKMKEWDIEKFSVEEIEVSREDEAFCNEHFKLKLENNVIVVYQIDEFGIETEYEQTGITTEYLTNEDILKLTAGIEVFGKESLSSVIEDYE